MITLPSEPDEAIRAAALHLAKQHESLDPADILDSCLDEITKRGGRVTEEGWDAAKKALHELLREQDHRSFAATADRLEAKGTPFKGEWADAAEVSRAFMARLARAEEQRPLLEGEATPARPARQEPLELAALPIVAYSLDMPVEPLCWLVKGMLARPGIGCAFGESQTGKTFWLIHLALCLAYGVPFFGKKTRKCGVVLVAAENYRSMVTRMKAAERDFLARLKADGSFLTEKDRALIEMIPRSPDLSRNGTPMSMQRSIMAAAARMQRQGHPLGLVAVDTLHAAMGGGDEQSAADAHFVIEPAQRVAEDHRAHFLYIHHTGKNLEMGARGSYAFKAAWDSEIELIAEGAAGPRAAKKSDMPRRGTILKMRDGEVGQQFRYTLRRVVVGHDEDGDEISTCVVDELAPLGEPAILETAPGAGRLKRDAETLLGLIRARANEGTANLATVRDDFAKAKPDLAPGSMRNAWSKATKELGLAGLVRTDHLANQIELVAPPEA